MVGTSLQLGFIKKIQLNYTNPGMNELVIESVITLKCMATCNPTL